MFDLADPETLTLVGSSGVERVAVKAATPRVALWRFDRAVAIASDRAAFDALQAEWRELEESAAGATLLPVLRLVPRRLRSSRGARPGF